MSTGCAHFPLAAAAKTSEFDGVRRGSEWAGAVGLSFQGKATFRPLLGRSAHKSEFVFRLLFRLQLGGVVFFFAKHPHCVPEHRQR